MKNVGSSRGLLFVLASLAAAPLCWAEQGESGSDTTIPFADVPEREVSTANYCAAMTDIILITSEDSSDAMVQNAEFWKSKYLEIEKDDQDKVAFLKRYDTRRDPEQANAVAEMKRLAQTQVMNLCFPMRQAWEADNG